MKQFLVRAISTPLIPVPDFVTLPVTWPSMGHTKMHFALKGYKVAATGKNFALKGPAVSSPIAEGAQGACACIMASALVG